MSEKFHFLKLEATGNDFILVDASKQDIPLEHLEHIAPEICNRKTGIGADGLLILHPISTLGADYTMIYKNADGSDAGMCGNGGRAIAFYASQNGYSDTHRFQVHEQVYEAFVHPGSHQVEISFPDCDAPSSISHEWLACVNKDSTEQSTQQASSSSSQFKADAAFRAYPQTEHVVLFSDDLLAIQPTEELAKLGRSIRNDELFHPKGTNVNFVYSQQVNHFQLETYERGVEHFTLACGTGAIASAMAMHMKEGGKAGSHLYHVTVQGGLLEVSFDCSDTATLTQSEHGKLFKKVLLKGPARIVFNGIWAGN